MKTHFTRLFLTIIFLCSFFPHHLAAVSASTTVWTTHGPLGGSVTSLVMDPLNPANLYAGTKSGVFRSANGGETWTLGNAGLREAEINCLAIDPKNPSTLYAGAQGVYKSTNGGISWVKMSSESMYNTTALGIDPKAPSTVYAGSNAGVSKTTDGGASWTNITTGLPDYYETREIAVDPSTSSTVYLATTNGLFKTTNGGESWNAINTGIDYPNGNSIAFDPTTPSTLYAIASDLYKSIDGGENWTLLSTVADNISLTTVEIDPASASILYAGSYQGGFKSIDGGLTWSRTTDDLTYIYAIAIDPVSPSTLFYGTQHGVSKSTDSGKTWNQANAGLTAASVMDIDFDPLNQATIYTVADGKVFKSIDSGVHWGEIHPDPLATNIYARTLVVDPKTPSTIYLGTTCIGMTSSGVYKSTDSGASWTAVNSGLSNRWVELLAIDPQTPTTLYAGPGNVSTGEYILFKSTNGGTTWSEIHTGWSNFFTYALVIDPAAPTTLYMATQEYGVLKSIDGGLSWNPANQGIPGKQVGTVVVDPHTPSTLYAGSGFSVYKSTDAGASWNVLNLLALNHAPVGAIAVDPNTPTTLYVGSGGAVYKSTDGGNMWEGLKNGFPGNIEVTIVAVQPASSSDVYAGTDGGGVFYGQQAAEQFYSIFGAAKTAGGAGVANVSIRVSDGRTVTTDANGNFQVAGLLPGTYTLTPSKAQYSFSPATQSVTVENSDVYLSNFVGQEIPIVLLPGLMGSRLYNRAPNAACLLNPFHPPYGEVWAREAIGGLGSLVLQPDKLASVNDCADIYVDSGQDTKGVFDIYQPFIQYFQNAGYTVRYFPYDWRLSIEDVALALNQQIDAWGYSQVYLVGHSMGGMLARTYTGIYPEDVAKVITVGAPYWGSPKLAYSMRSGALPADIPIPFNNTSINPALPLVADLIRNSPGMMQILPSEAYFNSAGYGPYYYDQDEALTSYDETTTFFESTYGLLGPQNAQLIRSGKNYHAAYDDFHGVNIDYYILAANNKLTPLKIREFPCFFQGVCYETRSFVYGDDTVPLNSAAIPGAYNANVHVTVFDKSQVSAGHTAMINDPAILGKILNILIGIGTGSSSALPHAASAAAPQPFIQLSVYGPGNVSVTDNENHFTGLDADGTLVNEIAEVTYTVSKGQTDVILPGGRTYTVSIQELSGAPLEVRVSELTPAEGSEIYDPNERALFVNVPSSANGEVTLPLDLSAGLNSLTLSVDQNQDGTPETTLSPDSILNATQLQDLTMPVTTIQVAGAKDHLGFYTGPLTISLSASDADTGVLYSEISLDGGNTWAEYKTPASVLAENLSTVYARSVDQAGNYEFPWAAQRLRPYYQYIPIAVR